MIGVYSPSTSIGKKITNFISKITTLPLDIISLQQIASRNFCQRLTLLLLEIEPGSDDLGQTLKMAKQNNPKLKIYLFHKSIPYETSGLPSMIPEVETAFSIPVDELILFHSLRKHIHLDLLKKSMDMKHVLPFKTFAIPQTIDMSIATPIMEFNENSIILASAAVFPLKCRMKLRTELIKMPFNEDIRIRIDRVVMRHPKKLLYSNENDFDIEKYPFILICSFVYDSFDEKMRVRKWIYQSFNNEVTIV